MNICSTSRTKYISPKKICEQYEISKAQIYRLLKLPVFKDCFIKTGEKSIRINQDKFYEILTQYYR